MGFDEKGLFVEGPKKKVSWPRCRRKGGSRIDPMIPFNEERRSRLAEMETWYF
jgi:hypothetical protein